MDAAEHPQINIPAGPIKVKVTFYLQPPSLGDSDFDLRVGPIGSSEATCVLGPFDFPGLDRTDYHPHNDQGEWEPEHPPQFDLSGDIWGNKILPFWRLVAETAKQKLLELSSVFPNWQVVSARLRRVDSEQTPNIGNVRERIWPFWPTEKILIPPAVAETAT